MYSTVQEVTDMIKPDALNELIGLGFIEDEVLKAEKISKIVEDSINDADAEIDGYLSKRYPTPLSSVPGVINKLSKDIAIYNVFSRSGIDEKTREQNYLSRYRNAVKYLENIASGRADVPGLSSPSQKAATGFNIISNKKIFGRSNMEGM